VAGHSADADLLNANDDTDADVINANDDTDDAADVDEDTDSD
jgi:hypothetical protein